MQTLQKQLFVRCGADERATSFHERRRVEDKVQDLMALAYHLPNQLHHVDRSFYFRREPNISMEAQLRQDPADLALPKRSASETSGQPRTDFKLTVKVADSGRQFYQTDSRTPICDRRIR